MFQSLSQKLSEVWGWGHTLGGQAQIQARVCAWGHCWVGGWHVEESDSKCGSGGMEGEAEALWLGCLSLGLEPGVHGASRYLWRPGSNQGGGTRWALDQT